MLITRECDYAVRVIRALSGAERLSVGEICEREEITAPFAYKILKKLQKAKLVRGYRGVHGGYSMNRTPGEITLFDIYTAIDPELMIIECMDPQYHCVRDTRIKRPALFTESLWRSRKSCGSFFSVKLFRNFSTVCDCADRVKSIEAADVSSQDK